MYGGEYGLGLCAPTNLTRPLSRKRGAIGECVGESVANHP